eukprot:Clim_evm16s246 gene=Clim_evmTU16s246
MTEGNGSVWRGDKPLTPSADLDNDASEPIYENNSLRDTIRATRITPDTPKVRNISDDIDESPYENVSSVGGTLRQPYKETNKSRRSTTGSTDSSSHTFVPAEVMYTAGRQRQPLPETPDDAAGEAALKGLENKILAQSNSRTIDSLASFDDGYVEALSANDIVRPARSKDLFLKEGEDPIYEYISTKYGGGHRATLRILQDDQDSEDPYSNASSVAGTLRSNRRTRNNRTQRSDENNGGDSNNISNGSGGSENDKRESLEEIRSPMDNLALAMKSVSKGKTAHRTYNPELPERLIKASSRSPVLPERNSAQNRSLTDLIRSNSPAEGVSFSRRRETVSLPNQQRILQEMEPVQMLFNREHKRFGTDPLFQVLTSGSKDLSGKEYNAAKMTKLVRKVVSKILDAGRPQENELIVILLDRTEESEMLWMAAFLACQYLGITPVVFDTPDEVCSVKTKALLDLLTTYNVRTFLTQSSVTKRYTTLRGSSSSDIRRSSQDFKKLLQSEDQVLLDEARYLWQMMLAGKMILLDNLKSPSSRLQGMVDFAVLQPVRDRTSFLMPSDGVEYKGMLRLVSYSRGAYTHSSLTLSKALRTDNSSVIINLLPSKTPVGFWINIGLTLVEGNRTYPLGETHRSAAELLNLMTQSGCTHLIATHEALVDIAVGLGDIKQSKRKFNLSAIQQVIIPVEGRVRRGMGKLFIDALKAYGLSSTVICPVLCTAECGIISIGTVPNEMKPMAISLHSLQEGVVRLIEDNSNTPRGNGEEVTTLFDCGEIAPGVSITVVDGDDQQPLPEGRCGVVCVRTLGSGQAYHLQEIESQRFFKRRLFNENAMDTGSTLGSSPRRTGLGATATHRQTSTSSIGLGHLTKAPLYNVSNLEGFVWNQRLYVVGRKQHAFTLERRRHYNEDILDAINQLVDSVRMCADNKVITFAVKLHGLRQPCLLAETPTDAENDEVARWMWRVVQTISQRNRLTLLLAATCPPGALYMRPDGQPALQRNGMRVMAGAIPMTSLYINDDNPFLYAMARVSGVASDSSSTAIEATAMGDDDDDDPLHSFTGGSDVVDLNSSVIDDPDSPITRRSRAIRNKAGMGEGLAAPAVLGKPIGSSETMRSLRGRDSLREITNTAQILLEWNINVPKHTGLIVCTGKQGQKVKKYSYKVIHEIAMEYALTLQKQGIGPGDRVIVAHRPGIDQYGAFYGCFYVGAVPTLVNPPEIVDLPSAATNKSKSHSDATRAAVSSWRLFWAMLLAINYKRTAGLPVVCETDVAKTAKSTRMSRVFPEIADRFTMIVKQSFTGGMLSSNKIKDVKYLPYIERGKRSTSLIDLSASANGVLVGAQYSHDQVLRAIRTIGDQWKWSQQQHVEGSDYDRKPMMVCANTCNGFGRMLPMLVNMYYGRTTIIIDPAQQITYPDTIFAVADKFRPVVGLINTSVLDIAGRYCLWRSNRDHYHSNGGLATGSRTSMGSVGMESGSTAAMSMYDEYGAMIKRSPASAAVSRENFGSNGSISTSVGGREVFDLSFLETLLVESRTRPEVEIVSRFEMSANLTPGTVRFVFSCPEAPSAVVPQLIREFDSTAASNGVAVGPMGAVLVSRTALEAGKVRIMSDASVADVDQSPASHTLDGTLLVPCGSLLPGTAAAVVDPATQRLCLRNEIGELWISAPGNAHLYASMTDSSQANLDGNGSLSGGGSASHRTMTDQDTKSLGSALTTATEAAAFNSEGLDCRLGSDGRTYVRTGTLGYVNQRQGSPDLYVCGNFEDSVVIEERCHYFADIEQSIADSCPSRLFYAGVLVFSVKNQLVALMESPISPDHCLELVVPVFLRVLERHNIALSVLCFVPRKTISATVYGEKQRARSQLQFLRQQLSINFMFVLGSSNAVEEAQSTFASPR